MIAKNLRCFKIVLSLLQNCVTAEALCDIVHYLIYRIIWGWKSRNQDGCTAIDFIEYFGASEEGIRKKGIKQE